MSGLLGENEQAANQIAFNLSSMTYMVAIGVGVTAMIRIGNEKGKKDFFNLRRLAISNFLLIFLLKKSLEIKNLFRCGCYNYERA